MPDEPTARSLREVFLAAAERTDPQDRADFLARACAGDTAFRQRIDALLAADSRAGPPPAEDPPGDAVTECTVGSRIGAYRLLARLGEGGHGVVYLAEQTEPVRRQVALKVIKLGMDTRQVVARFNAERQTLARMDHPHIARVLEAGATESGRPYFVMELVRGSRITEYCHQQRLSVRQRLELFILVCHAIQHAHQKGVIHRDIKPSNILVTVDDQGQPSPRIIDFGIAKAIEGPAADHTLFTSLEPFLGTPAYMSPEQATPAPGDIDTRSDIYSLGVLLYELLTGATPFDTRTLLADGIETLRQAIREREPPRPSVRLQRSLAALAGATADNAAERSDLRRRMHEVRGDLDCIVMQCLAKERGRRYATANALAMDLKRHLASEPVLARPPSRLYEFQRTVRRHRLGFTAVAGVVLSLAAGLVVSAWEASRARRAELAAEASADANARTAYNADVNRAAEALRQHDLAHARELLRRYVPRPGATDLRRWEWSHLAAEARGDDHLELNGHSNRVVRVRFLDPDTLLSVGHADRLALFWNLPSRRATRRVPLEIQPSSVAVANREHRLWYGYFPPFGTELREVDWLAGTERKATFTPTADFPGLVFVTPSPRGDFAALSTTGQVHVVDLARRVSVGVVEPDRPGPAGAAFSPDGAWLVMGSSEDRLHWWNLARRQGETDQRESNRTVNAFLGLAFSPDGRRLATVSETALTVWEVAQRKPVWRRPQAASTPALAWSPDGRIVATALPVSAIGCFEAERGDPVRILRGHTDQVQDLDFSPDGRQLASCSRNGEVKVWPLGTASDAPRELAIHPLDAGFSADGAHWYVTPVSDPAFAEIHDSTSFDAVGRIRLDGLKDPTGMLLAGGRTAVLFDRNDGRLVLRGEHEVTVENACPAGMVQLAASAAGDLLAVHSWADQRLSLWALPGLHRLRSVPTGLDAGKGYMRTVMAANGRRLAGVTGTGQLDVWDLPDLQRRYSRVALTPVESFALALSPDARQLVVASDDAPAFLLDLGHLEDPPRRLAAPVGSWPLAFSPDGSRLAVACTDRTHLVDPQTGESLMSLPRGGANHVAFTPDGRNLVLLGDRESSVVRAPTPAGLRFDWLQP